MTHSEDYITGTGSEIDVISADGMAGDPEYSAVSAGSYVYKYLLCRRTSSSKPLVFEWEMVLYQVPRGRDFTVAYREPSEGIQLSASS